MFYLWIDTGKTLVHFWGSKCFFRSKKVGSIFRWCLPSLLVTWLRGQPMRKQLNSTCACCYSWLRHDRCPSPGNLGSRNLFGDSLRVPTNPNEAPTSGHVFTMTGANSQTNGASLEDCHANFFSLVRLSFFSTKVVLEVGAGDPKWSESKCKSSVWGPFDTGQKFPVPGTKVKPENLRTWAIFFSIVVHKPVPWPFNVNMHLDGRDWTLKLLPEPFVVAPSHNNSTIPPIPRLLKHWSKE